ncbi:tyrosine-type recombinase/integrase [Anaerosalibacter sp. Marseille-P3206]|uniref:tyrosine-type recombinase/integrase n=1 Tax=Anaerosalibacter sp. Marseille-P3206 TaxID=1871005 RepID=UPI00098755F6|nr:tyrosine-type recombinase/integrase [Anaerosalibacter sp. Marseille-P3206]
MKYYEAVEGFLKHLESIDRSYETIKGYRKELGYFGRFLEGKYSYEKDVGDITIEDLEDYMYYLKKSGKMSATRSRVVYIFRSFYNYLNKRELCSKNLAMFLEPIRVKQTERIYLSEEEFILLTGKIDKPIVKVAVQTIFYTGLRVSETVNLTLDNVDLDEKIIYVIGGKGNKDRVIPICEKLYNILIDYIDNIRPLVDSNKFFCTKKTGKLSPQYINVILHKAKDSLKWQKNVSAHILRHSFASNLIIHNAPLPSVQKLLGHSDLRVTSRYIHQDLEQLKKAVKLL